MGCLAILTVGIFLSAPPPEEARRVAADILREEGFQQSFPGKRPLPEAPPRDRSSTGPSPLLEVLLWVGFGIAVVIAGVLLVGRLRGYTADVEIEEAPAAGSRQARAPPPEDEAAALAAEGRFEEAIHALLLLALHPLTTKRHLADSLTSREILQRIELPDGARSPITALVGAVEVAVFGERPADRADYEAAVEHYRTYRRACRGGVA